MSEMTREQVYAKIRAAVESWGTSQYAQHINSVMAHDAFQRQRIAQLEAEVKYLDDLFVRHSGREKAMAEIVFQHIKHGDEAHQEWLRRELVEVLCREDTKSCVTFDEMRSKIHELEAEVARLTEELHTVKVERGRNAMSHMNEYHRAEKWKQEAQWAARLIYDGATKDENSERAQRILDGQL